MLLLLVSLITVPAGGEESSDPYSVYEIGYLADGYSVGVKIMNLLENESIRVWPGTYNDTGFHFEDDNDSYLEVKAGENTTYVEINQRGEIIQYGLALRLAPVEGVYPDITAIDVEMTITAYDLMTDEIPRIDLLSYDAIARRYQENLLELEEEPPEEKNICGSVMWIGVLSILLILSIMISNFKR